MKTLHTDPKRWIAVGTLSAMALGGVAAMSTPAHAISSKTWKKVAIAGGVATGYGLIKHKGKIATIGAVTAGGAYYMAHRKHKKELAHNRHSAAWYKSRYGRNWYSHYKRGY